MTARRLSFWRVFGAGWILLLALSHLWRRAHPFVPRHDPAEVSQTLANGVRIATVDSGPGGASGLPVVLLHGSPGDNAEVRGIALALARTRRVIAPDLPGFGGSTRTLPDYSIRAHARYILELLDSLGVPRAHVVGFSMGGGVAIEMAGARPDRIASLTLLSAIGVQEYELLGDYLLNHAVHGLQLGALWLLREGVPHFGRWDDGFMTVEYARNFYDTDQRPLRGILQTWQGPALVIQGDRDFLVPPAIAAEHGRIIPQSEVELIPGDHFMAFARAGEMADRIGTFLARVEAGSATTRATADSARLARAAEPWDPRTAPHPVGFSLAIILFLLALATLVSEDLACIAAGLLVGRGSVGFLPAVIACLVGIVAGDLLLYLAGRWIGRPALRRAPLRWFVSEADVERSSAWFSRRGVWLVLASRFMPGTRLPTYVAAGMLHTRLLPFLGAFVLASLLWVPLLVGVSAFFGGQLLEWFSRTGRLAGPAFVAGLALLYLVVRLLLSLATWRGRRLLVSRWRRLTRWEFWPIWAVYPPVVLYIAWLAIRHRSLTAFMRANPAIPRGGLIGESKYEILKGMGLEHPGPNRVARTRLLPARTPVEERMRALLAFDASAGLGWPVVLKPDVGERGKGVQFADGPAAAEAYLRSVDYDVLAQERAVGAEFGVFYYRMPDEPAGRIFAITEKRFPEVVGDGVHTLEHLILADDRAVCSARTFLRAHAGDLARVPSRGERVTLTRLGTHSRGALFLDGARLKTPALERAVDELSKRYAGFYFGRYDLVAPDAAALMAGSPLIVLELNGVSSEATSIYDPLHNVGNAWRTLCAQWRIAFEIGKRNGAR